VFIYYRQAINAKELTVKKNKGGIQMKSFWVLFLLLVSSTFLSAQESLMTLNDAINKSAANLTNRLPKDSKVVVLNFISPTEELSEYSIEELTVSIVNNGRLTVVDRRNLNLLQQEMNFQMSGDVNDETAQAIGKKLGAQSIVSGSITALGERYRMRIQAIEVETARIQAAETTTVILDSTLAALLKIPFDDPKSFGLTDGDFSIGKRVMYGFLNLGFGLGSFLMGDWAGGLTVAGGEVVGLSLIIYEVMVLGPGDSMVGVPGGIGLGIIGITAVYGFIRPFLFNKNKSSNEIADLFNRVNIAVIPSNDGIKRLGLSYTWHL
jgi:TolB-like protein